MGVMTDPMTAPAWLSARQAPTNAAVRTGGSTARMVLETASSASSISSPSSGSSGDFAATNDAMVDGSGVGKGVDAAEPPGEAVANTKLGAMAWPKDHAPTGVRAEFGLDGATVEERGGVITGSRSTERDSDLAGRVTAAPFTGGGEFTLACAGADTTSGAARGETAPDTAAKSAAPMDGRATTVEASSTAAASASIDADTEAA